MNKKFITIAVFFLLLVPISSSATTLSYSLSGKILLQVESHGEAWYVNPTDRQRYYLGRPDDAFGIMKKLSLGIKHAELLQYQSSVFPGRLVGRILLDVEAEGAAYYISPRTFESLYLGRPAEAFAIMKTEGLGISNVNLQTIPTANISAIPPLTDKQTCEASGGRWQITGLRGDYGCALIYSDGGKYCTSSDQCVKDCIVNYNTTQGVCQESSVIMNCHETIEEYNAGKPMYCQ